MPLTCTCRLNDHPDSSKIKANGWRGNHGFIHYLLSSQLPSPLPTQVFTTTHYKDLLQLPFPKGAQTIEKHVNEMRNWRAMYGQCVPHKTVQNMITNDNPVTLPIDPYAANSPTVHTQEPITRSDGLLTDGALVKQQRFQCHTGKQQRLRTN